MASELLSRDGGIHAQICDFPEPGCSHCPRFHVLVEPTLRALPQAPDAPGDPGLPSLTKSQDSGWEAEANIPSFCFQHRLTQLPPSGWPFSGKPGK